MQSTTHIIPNPPISTTPTDTTSCCPLLISAIRDYRVLIHEHQRGIADQQRAMPATLTTIHNCREESLP